MGFARRFLPPNHNVRLHIDDEQPFHSGGFSVKWCADQELAEILQLDRGYTVERLRREDIPLLISSVETLCPDISVGIGSVYLRRSFYEGGVALHGNESKDIAVWVFRHPGELVGMWSDERIPESLSLYGRLMVVSPRHRKAHIGGRIISSSAARARPKAPSTSMRTRRSRPRWYSLRWSVQDFSW